MGEESRYSRNGCMGNKREEVEETVAKVRESCNREKEEWAKVRYYNTHNNKAN